MNIELKFILFVFIFCHTFTHILGECIRDPECEECCSFPELDNNCMCIEEKYYDNLELIDDEVDVDCARCQPKETAKGCKCVMREYVRRMGGKFV